jgi:hypothetical protein
MTMQELEILSINQLLELREIVDAEIRRKKEIERDEALKELNEAWKKFREVCPYDTCWGTIDCEACGQPVDVDLYDVIDAYGFK